MVYGIWYNGLINTNIMWMGKCMLLRELWDKPVKYYADEDEYGQPVYKFQVGGKVYQFMYDISMSGNCVDVSFCALGKGSDCEFGIMNSGKSVLVFSTAVTIMRQILADIKPRLLTFSAKESSRQKLYLRMVKTLLPTWGTYTYDDGGSMGLLVRDPTFSISSIQELILADIKNDVGSLIFPPLFFNYEIGHAVMQAVGGQSIINVPTPAEMSSNPKWEDDYVRLCKEALITDYQPCSLSSIPEQYRNYDFCMTAVQRKGMELQFVPVALPGYTEIAKVAVQQDSGALAYIPVALQAEIAAKDQADIRNPVENQGILQKT